MRLGCGCLMVTIVCVGLVAAGAWVGYRGLQEPEVKVETPTAEDGLRGQQKIYTVLRGGAGRARARTTEIVISEREVNGFLSRHLADAGELPVKAGTLKLLDEGRVEFKGRVTLRDLLPAQLLPAAWLDRPIWLHLRARASLEVEAARGHRRHLRLDVERYAVGRQWLPGVLVRPLLSRAMLALFRWPLPDAVEAITVESEKAVVRTAS